MHRVTGICISEYAGGGGSARLVGASTCGARRVGGFARLYDEALELEMERGKDKGGKRGGKRAAEAARWR